MWLAIIFLASLAIVLELVMRAPYLEATEAASQKSINGPGEVRTGRAREPSV
jgi:hypothetical protein